MFFLFAVPPNDPQRLLRSQLRTQITARLENGEFQYLRNKYSRDKKKIEGKKVSGSSTDEVREAKVEASEMYSFLSWLDPYVQPRKNSSNYVINVDTHNENQEDGDEIGRAHV